MNGIIAKSLKYVKDSLYYFGLYRGIIFSYHFFRRHFLHKMGEKTSKVYFLQYHPRKFGNSMIDKKIKYNLYYRIDTTDVPLIASILLGSKEYDIPLDASRFDCVLDLGANIGLFTVLYSNMYPNKKFIAVEPEEKNYTILSLNTKGYQNVKIENAGIWYRCSNLKIIDHGNNWGFSVEEIKDKDIENDCIGIDIDTLCERYDLRGNLLVKMDIEGSEYPIFKNIEFQNWIKKTYALIIELHDTSKENEHIFKFMQDKGFIRSMSGENVVFVRK